MRKVSLDEQVRCVEREMAMRTHVYPKRVAAGKMTQRHAELELETMRAVLETVKAVRDVAFKSRQSELWAAVLP